MDLAPPRGSRDFLPPEAFLREHVTDTLKNAFRRYGFSPLETPVMEHVDVLSSKFAGGEEILKETYRLTDQGGRKLGLRYDLTVPLCRVFASNMLAKPFKRYQIAPVFRDGPLKKGRYREFYQCDVDTLGVSSVLAEAELLALSNEAFQALGLLVVFKVNNRKLLNGLLEDAGVPKEKQNSALLSLDKLEKIGSSAVLVELAKEHGVSTSTGKKLLVLFDKVGYGQKALTALANSMKSAEGREGVQELQQLFGFLEAFGVQNTEFVPSLSRGLNYYTSTVFEVFAKEGEITSSLAAGGRYDDLIGNFSGKEKVPAVGISFGLDVICEVLKEKGETAQQLSSVYVFGIGEVHKESVSVAQTLRKSGIDCFLDLSNKGISKNLDFASKQHFPWAILVGIREIKEGLFTLKNLKSGQERKLSLQEIILQLKKG